MGSVCVETGRGGSDEERTQDGTLNSSGYGHSFGSLMTTPGWGMEGGKGGGVGKKMRKRYCGEFWLLIEVTMDYSWGWAWDR